MIGLGVHVHVEVCVPKSRELMIRFTLRVATQSDTRALLN